MKQHRFRVTVEHLALPDGSAPVPPQSLQFEAGNHDDILAIAKRMNERTSLSEADAQALAIGMKLFGEVMLHNRDLPLFSEFAPHFRSFMQRIKRGPQPAAPEGDQEA